MIKNKKLELLFLSILIFSISTSCSDKTEKSNTTIVEVPNETKPESTSTMDINSLSIEEIANDFEIGNEAHGKALIKAMLKLVNSTTDIHSYYFKSESVGLDKNENYTTETFYDKGLSKTINTYSDVYYENFYDIKENTMVYYDSISDVGVTLIDYIKSEDELIYLGKQGNLVISEYLYRPTEVSIKEYEGKKALYISYQDDEGSFKSNFFMDLETGFVLYKEDYYDDLTTSKMTTKITELKFDTLNADDFKPSYDPNKIKPYEECNTG